MQPDGPFLARSLGKVGQQGPTAFRHRTFTAAIHPLPRTACPCLLCPAGPALSADVSRRLCLPPAPSESLLHLSSLLTHTFCPHRSPVTHTLLPGSVAQVIPQVPGEQPKEAGCCGLAGLQWPSRWPFLCV